jgi:dienelactone hydrolase
VTTVAPLRWLEHDAQSKGVRERRVDVAGPAGVVPALLWTPAEPGTSRPLVCIQHGAADTKAAPYAVALGRMLVRHHGLCAVSIDGPVHGERRADGSTDGAAAMVEFGQRWYAEPTLLDAMVVEWRAVVDAVQSLPEVTPGPYGYWGLSMGTILGLPLVASDDRVAAAVLGLMGVAGPNKERVRADAAAVRCPVLFLVQWDDALFPRDKAFALFDALGSADKRLHANPGSHGAVPADEFDLTAHFLGERLGTEA